jgi:NAD(P)-dependent dehydrogenase (short-subunit alcohol dehydrogenase family)
MTRRLKDSVVVVTGASSGIGFATVREFARRGSRVVAGARRADVLNALRDEGKATKGSVVPVRADVTDEIHVNALARDAVDRFGRIDVWVNNAAVTAFARIDDLPLEDYDRLWNTNVMGYVRGIRAVLPYLREQGQGVIVNVSSIAGRVGQPYASAYSMTKHAIRALSMGLRQELLLEKAKRIHVCTVMPASIDTPLFQHGANYTGWTPKPMPPVYPPEMVARAIAECARRPKREVFVGGAARTMNLQSHLAPEATERNLAQMVDKAHFDKSRPAEVTKGNLYEPVSFGADASGGWRGKSKTVRRTVLAAAALGALAIKRSQEAR